MNRFAARRYVASDSPIFWLFGVLLLLWALPARATQRELAIRLGAPGAIAPSHVCVASELNTQLSDTEKKLAGSRIKLSAGLSLDLPTRIKEAQKADAPGGASPAPGAMALPPNPEDWSSDDLVGQLNGPRMELKGSPARGENAACGVWRNQPPATQLDAEPWKVGGETANACAVPQRYVGACSFHVDPHQLDDNEKLSCRANAQRSLARGRLNVPVLRFEGVKIIDFHLDGNIVRITIDVAPKEQNRPQLVKVIGGDYLESAALPLKELSGADVIDFPLLTPRCGEQRVAIPSFECAPGSDWQHVKLGIAGAYLELSRNELGSELVLDVPNDRSGRDTLTLLACGGVDKRHYAHEFEANWNAVDSAARRELSPRSFEFTWTRSRLIGGLEDPPTAQIAETGQSCLAVRKTGEAPVYRCEGSLALPATVRFTRPRPASVCERGKKPDGAGTTSGASAAEDQWELKLLRPGQTLNGFVRYEQRELALCWVGWSASAKDEVPPAATRWGDRIDYVVLGTADGRQLRVRPGADRVRIAGIDAGDQLTVHFEGDRAFNIVPERVARGGVLTIIHPAGQRADFLVFSLTFNGGLRYVPHVAGPTSWNPYGEVDILATFRGLRNFTYARASNWYLDPELKVGMLFTTNPYSSQLVPLEADPRWQNVMMLMFPIEGSLHFFANQRGHFALGAGIVLSREVFASDNAQVSNPARFSLSASVGLGVTRTFAIDFVPRLVVGNDVVRRTFTDGGVEQRSIVNPVMMFLGARFRFDDFFDGALVKAPFADAPEKPKANAEEALGEQHEALNGTKEPRAAAAARAR